MGLHKHVVKIEVVNLSSITRRNRCRFFYSLSRIYCVLKKFLCFFMQSEKNIIVIVVGKRRRFRVEFSKFRLCDIGSHEWPQNGIASETVSV